MIQHRKRKSFDKTGIGLLAGFVLPIVIFFMIYIFGEKNISLSDYINSLWHLQALIKLGSLCVFGNVAIFFGFLQVKHEQAARGVLGATIVYALAVLISRAF